MKFDPLVEILISLVIHKQVLARSVIRDALSSI